MNRFLAMALALSLTACTGSAFTEALFEFHAGTEDAGQDAPAPDVVSSSDAASEVSIDAAPEAQRDAGSDRVEPDAAPDAPTAVDASEAGTVRACPSTAAYYTKAQAALAGDRPQYCPPACGQGECCYGAIVCVQE